MPQNKNTYAEILNAFGRLNHPTRVLLVLCFLFYFYKDEVSHVIDVRILNKDRVVSKLDSDVLITRELERLMIEGGADRAYIFRFHNGVKYYDGTHKNKMSCDYEVVRQGISHEAQNLQDLPVSLFPYFIQQVVQYNMTFFDMSQIEDSRTRVTLEEQGINGIIALPYYRDNKLIAIIGIDYVMPLELTKEEIDAKLESEIEYIKKRFKEVGDLLI